MRDRWGRVGLTCRWEGTYCWGSSSRIATIVDVVMMWIQSHMCTTTRMYFRASSSRSRSWRHLDSSSLSTNEYRMYNMTLNHLDFDRWSGIKRMMWSEKDCLFNGRSSGVVCVPRKRRGRGSMRTQEKCTRTFERTRWHDPSSVVALTWSVQESCVVGHHQADQLDWCNLKASGCLCAVLDCLSRHCTWSIDESLSGGRDDCLKAYRSRGSIRSM